MNQTYSLQLFSVIAGVCRDLNQKTPASLGANAALVALRDHWTSDNASPLRIWEDIEGLREQLDVLRTELLQRLQDEPTLTVSAEVHSDDRTREAAFEASAWLSQAATELVLTLAANEWATCEAADRVAEYYADSDPRIAAVLGDGFEVSVDDDEAMAYLQRYRPEVWAEVLCQANDVVLVEAEEPEIAGMWDWLGPNGDACDCSFETREEAALNAVQVLNLA